jgi:hypothetical protein
MSILEGKLKLTQEANDLVAIIAFFGVHGHFLADHAAALFDEVSLEVILHGVWINLHEGLDRWEAALAQDTVDLMIRLNEIVSIEIGDNVVLFSVHI